MSQARKISDYSEDITLASKDQNSVVLELRIPAFAGMTDYLYI
jgi:hypothetical protein